MSSLSERTTIQQLLAYGLAGATGTSLHYVFAYTLWQHSGIPVVAASTVGAIAGAITNYLLSYTVVFKSQSRHLQAARRFAITAVAGFAINSAVLQLLLAEFNVFASQLVATACVFFFGYVVNRKWSFHA